MIMSKAKSTAETNVQAEEVDGVTDLPAKPEPDTHEFFKTFKTYVRMGARGEEHGVLIDGRPGIGKSFQAETVLKEEVEDDESPCMMYEFVDGYLSPMALYEELYRMRYENAVLVLDDVDGIADNDTAVALLKAALEGQGSGDKRTVSWQSKSSKLDDDVPDKFEFKGSIIMMFNDVPDNPHFNAVKSRCMPFDMDFDYDERMTLIHEVAKASHDDLEYGERMEVANWLINHSQEGMAHVDLRTLFKCFSLYSSSVIEGDEWKIHAAEQIGIDDDAMQAMELLEEYSSHEEAARKFPSYTRHEETEKYFEAMAGETTEAKLAAELYETKETTSEAKEVFAELTGRSERTFNRRRTQAHE